MGPLVGRWEILGLSEKWSEWVPAPYGKREARRASPSHLPELLLVTEEVSSFSESPRGKLPQVGFPGPPPGGDLLPTAKPADSLSLLGVRGNGLAEEVWTIIGDL